MEGHLPKLLGARSGLANVQCVRQGTLKCVCVYVQTYIHMYTYKHFNLKHIKCTVSYRLFVRTPVFHIMLCWGRGRERGVVWDVGINEV